MKTLPTTLSEQDAMLVRLLAEGRTDAAATRMLGIPRRTFQRRLRRIFEKLGATSRFQAGVLAERAGWTREGEDQ